MPGGVQNFEVLLLIHSFINSFGYADIKWIIWLKLNTSFIQDELVFSSFQYTLPKIA